MTQDIELILFLKNFDNFCKLLIIESYTYSI